MAISVFLIGSTKNRKGPASPSGGYTLIEVAVSIGIITMIMFVAVGYGRGIDRQLALIRAQTQIVAVINQAKGLSQNFLLSPPSGYQICGYGVAVEHTGPIPPIGSFTVFQDLVPAIATCAAADGLYTTGPLIDEAVAGSINKYQLDTNVFEFNLDSTKEKLLSVVFIPPDPTVKINASASIESAYVGVRLKAVTASRFEVKVNKFAQINIE